MTKTHQSSCKNDPGLDKRGKYRHHSESKKRQIVEETLESGASVSVVARRHDVNANQVFAWRQQYRRGELCSQKAVAALVPVGVIGEMGSVSGPSDLTNLESERKPSQPKPASFEGTVTQQPKMIEVELKGGTRIRIDASVKGPVLAQVLKLVRSLA